MPERVGGSQLVTLEVEWCCSIRRALLDMGLFQGGGGVVKRNENAETLVVRSCVDPKASANNPD